MIPEIKNPEDWHKVSSILIKLKFSMPEFYNDYSKLINNIELKVRELSLIDVKLKRNNSQWYKQQRYKKISEINETIRTFSKLHMIAVLSKR